VLFDTLHELVGVGHYLRDQVVLIVVFQVVDLLQILIVLLGHILDICQQIFVLQIHSPEQLEIVFFLNEHGFLVLLSGLSQGKKRVARWLHRGGRLAQICSLIINTAKCDITKLTLLLLSWQLLWGGAQRTGR